MVKWFKDGTEIKASKKYEIKSEGASRTLTVNLAESTDTAVYTCQTKSDKQEFKVQVKGEQRAAHRLCPNPTATFPSWEGGGEFQTLKLFQPQGLSCCCRCCGCPTIGQQSSASKYPIFVLCWALRGARKPMMGASPGICSRLSTCCFCLLLTQ